MTTTPLIGALAPMGDPSTAREVAMGAARDAMAARMIADAAERGNPHAAAFADEAQAMLGAARVRRARAARLRDAASKASLSGYHDLARWGAEAGVKEQRAAERLEAAVVQGVRQSHSPGAFGYVSPEEQSLLSRKSSLESMTQAQLEQDFANLLQQISDGASNFGADGDEDEEVDTTATASMAWAAAIYGGDLPSVFGADVYPVFWGAAKSSADRLKARLEKKKARLEKAERKLESLEDAGKKGLQVMWLRGVIKRLEKSIEKIEGKLGNLGKSAKQVAKSERAAKRVSQAETQVVKEAVKDGDEPLGDQEADEELAAAVEVFGLRPRRAARIRRRIVRLRSRGRSGRAARLARRLDPRFARRRWRRRFPGGPVVAYPAAYPVYDPGYVPVASPEYLEEGEEEEVEDVEEDGPGEGEDQLGADTPFDEEMGREVLLGFFERRATAFGATATDPNDPAFGGFFDNVSNWFSNLWQGVKGQAAEQRSATERARAARAPHTPGIQTARRALREQRQERTREGREAAAAARAPFTPGIRAQADELKAMREARHAAAKAARRGDQGGQVVIFPTGGSAGPRSVRGAGGYVYTQFPDGAIRIEEGSPTGSGTTLRSGKAWAAITQEIGPHPGTDLVGALFGIASPGFFESIAQPTTKRERVLAIAQHLDRALKQFGPTSEPAKELRKQLEEAKEEASEEGGNVPLTEEEQSDLQDDVGFAFGYDGEGSAEAYGASGRRLERRLRRLEARIRRAMARGRRRRVRRLMAKRQRVLAKLEARGGGGADDDSEG